MTSVVPKTAFLGLSHLGLVSSVCWASLNRETLGVDWNRDVVESLRGHVMPLDEPGLSELFERSRRNLSFSTDMPGVTECPIVIVSKDVPTNEDNESDLSAVRELVDRAIPHLRPGVTIVVMSQVPVGFSRRLGERIRSARPNLSFDLRYWVETLIIGAAVERYLRPERIILGHSAPGQPLAAGFEAALAEWTCPIFKMSYESAELTKMAINVYLSSAVTFANTMADLCEAVAADWTEMVPALQSDRRIGRFSYLRPSLGIAGGNLERDLVTLQRVCATHGVDSGMIDTILEYNGRRYDWIHRKLRAHVFVHTENPTVCIWGLAYKKGTSSTKNSASVRLVRDLRGIARIHLYDPVVRLTMRDSSAVAFDDRYEALEGADCLVITTDWDEFSSVDGETLRRRMKRPVVIDCVGALSGSREKLTDVDYVAMGAG